MRYLKAIKSVGIIYGKEEGGGGNLTIKEYSNSEWAGNYTTKKSTSGFLFMLNKGSFS